MKNRIKLMLSFFLSGMMILSTWTVMGISPKEPEKIPTRIKVVMDDNYPPYAFRDEHGQLQGITIDQWKIWEKKTGISVELEGMEWGKALQAAKNGKYDIIDTIFKNPEREQFLTFSNPYADIDVCIFFHKNISGINGVAALKGFNVGVKKGDDCISFLRNNQITDFAEYNSYESLILAVKEQQTVVFVMDKPSALYYLYKMGLYDQFNVSEPLYTGKIHRAVKKQNTTLLNVIDSGFDNISQHEYETIERRWLGTSFTPKKLIKKILIGISIALLFVSSLFGWILILRGLVKHKTKELTELIQISRDRENKLQTLLDAIPDVVLILDKNGKYLEFHTKNESQLLFSPEDFLGKTVSDLFPKDFAETIIQNIHDVLEKKEIKLLEYEVINNGQKKYHEGRIVAYEDEKIMFIVRDITEKKLAELKIIEMSIFDSLTGLYNRNYFESQINAFKWNPNIRNIAFVLCDLDGLKFINDTLGHEAGDQCLKIVADELTKVFREGDIIARIGGDEFAIFMENTTVDEIESMRNTIKSSLSGLKMEETPFPISISMGYAISSTPDTTLEMLSKEADDYMYREKLHQQKSAKSEIVNVLLRMLEARDFITEGHGERLQKLASALAAKIGFNEQDINDIKLLARFHDIGKVGVPDEILFKESRLTDSEYTEMKRHSEIGFRIAKSIPDLAYIADWIQKHHEWWNGEGYPFGLSGQSIPVQCRILSIVDAYDAITSDRPYRKALSKEFAINELRRCAGKQFDPEFTKIFIQMIEDQDSVFEERKTSDGRI